MIEPLCHDVFSDKESGGTSEANHQIIGNEVFSFPVQEKCKLVGQLVKSPGITVGFVLNWSFSIEVLKTLD